MKSCIIVVVTIMVSVQLADAQTKVPRIGFLSPESHQSGRFEAFPPRASRAGLCRGENIAIEYRGCEDNAQLERLARNWSGPGLTNTHCKQIGEFAVKQRLASVFGWRDYVEAGGLMSYGPNHDVLWKRLAQYTDKILKGSKPSQLPVELPTKFELVINLKTAKQIGLTIPPNVLARADKVIK